MQEEDAPVMEGEASDGADGSDGVADGSDGVADGSATDVSPYSKHSCAVALHECFARMTSIAQACREKIGYTTETVLRMFNDVPTAGQSANQWNLYQKYANADENRAAEHACFDEEFRVKLAADPEAVATWMSNDELRQSYPAFQQAYPGADAMELLECWNDLEVLGKELTIGMRRKHFNKTAKKKNFLGKCLLLFSSTLIDRVVFSCRRLPGVIITRAFWFSLGHM
jgi:hypothetical protein